MTLYPILYANHALNKLIHLSNFEFDVRPQMTGYEVKL